MVEVGGEGWGVVVEGRGEGGGWWLVVNTHKRPSCEVNTHKRPSCEVNTHKLTCLGGRVCCCYFEGLLIGCDYGA